jgi:hypothetical protein
LIEETEVRQAPTLLLTLILVLTAAAGAVLVHCDRTSIEEESPSREFHQLVGVGFGPALDLEPCERSFDPRLCSECPHDCGPIIAGMVFCPAHACSIFDPAPETRSQEPPPDAQAP